MPALADIARDDHPIVVIQKSAQVGATELLVDLSLWAADTGYAGRGHALFLMPTQNMMDDFAQSRYDRALQDDPYLRSRLQPEPPRRKGADSKRLKHLGPGYIFLRGADSRRQMDEGALELARKRLSSSQRGLLRIASTPRLPQAGVNGLYLQSDQRRYLLPCPGCGLEQPLTWEENVDREQALVICSSCRHPMDVLAQGHWQAQAPGNEHIHGYQLNRLYSPWANIKEMIEASEATTPFELQEFQNSDLGEAFAPPGGGVSVDVLDRCRQDYSLDDYGGQACAMGVDVGTKLHVVIREIMDREKKEETEGPRLWFAADLDSFDQLDGLMQRLNVKKCVIDSQPEAHLARLFAKRHGSRVWLARYDRHDSGHDMQWAKGDDPNIYHVNRLEALDEMFLRLREGRALLPADARQLGGRVRESLGEYYRELLSPKRTIEQDSQGNWVERWVDNRKADHYAHAEVYCMLAGQRTGGLGVRWMDY